MWDKWLRQYGSSRGFAEWIREYEDALAEASAANQRLLRDSQTQGNGDRIACDRVDSFIDAIELERDKVEQSSS